MNRRALTNSGLAAFLLGTAMLLISLAESGEPFTNQSSVLVGWVGLVLIILGSPIIGLGLFLERKDREQPF